MKSIRKLKDAFGVTDTQEIVATSGLKRELEELIATGKYTTLKELAKATGYSHSYVCRVLKHRK